MREQSVSAKISTNNCLPQRSLYYKGRFFFFFFNIYILLKYSWLTMFQVHNKVIRLYIYTYNIFDIILHYRLLQDNDYSSLHDTVNLCHLLHIFLKLEI